MSRGFNGMITYTRTFQTHAYTHSLLITWTFPPAQARAHPSQPPRCSCRREAPMPCMLVNARVHCRTRVLEGRVRPGHVSERDVSARGERGHKITLERSRNDAGLSNSTQNALYPANEHYSAPQLDAQGHALAALVFPSIRRRRPDGRNGEEGVPHHPPLVRLITLRKPT